MSNHPEHDKLRAVADKSQICGEFLEWLLDKGWEPQEHGSVRIEVVLAEFFEIDQSRLEAEKIAMLEELRV